MTILILLILALSIIGIVSERKFVISIDYGACTHNPKYIKSSNCSVALSGAYLDVRLQRDIKTSFVTFTFTVQVQKIVRTFLHLKHQNACDFLNGKSSRTMTFIRKKLKKYGEFPKQCPIKKEFHFLLKNIVFHADNFPAFTPNGNFTLKGTIECDKEFCFSYDYRGFIEQK